MKEEKAAFNKGCLTVKHKRSNQNRQPLYGIQPLGLDNKRDGLLYVPPGYNPHTPSPLAVMLHGHGGAQHGLSLLQYLADAYNLILLVPVSRKET